MGEVAAFADERLIHEALGNDDMRDCVQNRDVRSGLQREVVVGLDMRALDQVDAARIDDDEPGAGAQSFLEARGKDRMGVGRIRSHDHDDVRLLDGLEILRARRGAVGLG